MLPLPRLVVCLWIFWEEPDGGGFEPSTTFDVNAGELMDPPFFPPAVEILLFLYSMQSLDLLYADSSASIWALHVGSVCDVLISEKVWQLMALATYFEFKTKATKDQRPISINMLDVAFTHLLEI